MGSVRYHNCPQCSGTRLIRFLEDQERQFYHCSKCGGRWTYVTEIDGMSDDWPSEIFAEGVRQGLFNDDGSLVS